MAYDSGRRPDRRGAAVRLARAERLESRVAPGVFLAWFAAWESLSGAPETAIAAPALQPTESTGRLRPLAASTGNTLGPPPDDWATLLAAERVAHGASPQPGVAPMASVASPAEQASVVDGALANWLAQPPTETPEEAASVLLGPALPAPAIPPATAGGASAAAGGAAPQSSGGGSAAPVTFAAGAASGGFVASAAAVGSPTTQAGTPRPEAAAGLSLIDASGAAVDTSDNANTVVVGAATWCPKCADFKAQLAEAPAAVEGLRVVFAFGDEGGAGPGGVRDAAFLDGLPGEVAFYAEGSVRADRYPTAFNPASGLFDTHAADAVDAWAAGAWGAQPALRLTDAAGQPLGVRPGPDTLVVGAATWCGYCAQLKQQLATPEMRQATEGLTVVFAFADEGGTGPGGVRDAAFLDSLPGEVAFLAPGGVRPSSFPSVYDPATGAFAGSAFTAIDAWIQAASAAAAEPVAAGATAASAATTCELPGDYNADGVVDGADYTVWRDTLGSTSDLRADGQPDGVVDQLDYLVWRDRYGERCPEAAHTMFVTSRELSPGPNVFPPVGASIGSLEGGDWQCSLAASTAGLISNWDGFATPYKAVLSTLSESARSRLSISGSVTNMAGQIVANDESDLFDGSLANAIRFDELGTELASGTRVWTGTNSSGFGIGEDCGAWVNSGDIGRVGDPSSNDSSWILESAIECTQPARLYCISQPIQENPPGDFSINGPQSPATTETPRLSWSAADAATSYDAVIATTPAGAGVVQSHTRTGESVQLDPIANGVYDTLVSVRESVGVTAASNRPLEFTADTPAAAASAATTCELPGDYNADGVVDGADYTVWRDTLGSTSDLRADGQPDGVVDQLDYLVWRDRYGERCPEASHTIFVTSFDVGPGPDVYPPLGVGLGSLEGGDWQCSFAASNAGLISNWDGFATPYKAVLSTLSESARSRLSISGSVTNMAGQIVANDESDLFDGSLTNAIRYDEFGTELAVGTMVWTGSDVSGFGTGDDCGAWNNSGQFGRVGSPLEVGTRWIGNSVVECTQPARLYCISQPIQEDPPGDFTIIGPQSPVSTETPRLSWSAADAATSYDAVIATTPAGAGVVRSHPRTGESVQLDPIANGVYDTLVSVRESVGVTAAGDSPLEFTVDTPAAAASAATTCELPGDYNADGVVDGADYTVWRDTLGSTSDLRADGQPEGVVDQLDYLVWRDRYGERCPEVSHTMFVTSRELSPGPNVFPPDGASIGSLEGGDWQCSLAASNAGLISNWDGFATPYKAVLSGAAINARDRLTISGTITNRAGQVIANDLEGLFDGAIANPVGYDEFGSELAAGTRVWTGSNGAGFGSPDDCSDWTNSAGLAETGDPLAADGKWLSVATLQCTQPARLYCISQPIQEDPPGDFTINGPQSPVTTETPLLSWSAADAVTSYDAVIATTPAGAGVVQSHTRTGESVQLDPIANGVYDTLVSVRESVGVTAAGDRPLEFTAGRPIDL